VAASPAGPNGQWRPRYRDAAGKEHARHFEKKADAQAWLDSVTTSVLTGAYVDPKRTRVTLAEWAGQWLESKVDLKPTTYRCYEVSLRVHGRCHLARSGDRPGREPHHQ
jgi:hypothetical protein